MLNEWLLTKEIAELTGMTVKRINNYIDNNSLETQKNEEGLRMARLKDVIAVILRPIEGGKDEVHELSLEEKRLDVELKRQKLKAERDRIRAEEREQYRTTVSLRLDSLRNELAKHKSEQKTAGQIMEAIEGSKAQLDKTIEIYEDT